MLRNGVEIGRARLTVTNPDKALGTHAFIVKSGAGNGESVLVSGAAARNWMAVPMPGYADRAGSDLAAVVGGRLRMPQDFARQLYPLLVPGTTLLIMDAPVLAQNTSDRMTVMGAGVPNRPHGYLSPPASDGAAMSDATPHGASQDTVL